MTNINRLQQGIFEGLASMNRPAGSGGGSGLFPSPQTAFNNALGQGVTGNVFTTVTGSVLNSASPTTSFFLLLGYLSLNWTAGAQTAIVSPFVDGTQVQNMGVGPFAAGGTVVTIPITYVTDSLAPGQHTFDIRVNAGAATTYNLQQFAFYLFQLH